MVSIIFAMGLARSFPLPIFATPPTPAPVPAPAADAVALAFLLAADNKVSPG